MRMHPPCQEQKFAWEAPRYEASEKAHFSHVYRVISRSSGEQAVRISRLIPIYYVFFSLCAVSFRELRLCEVKLQVRLIERSRKIVPRRALFASFHEVCGHEMPQVVVTFRGFVSRVESDLCQAPHDAQFLHPTAHRAWPKI